MTTAANVRKTDSSHWYTVSGEPCYELKKKTGEGMKRPTLADARILNLLPSSTTILKLLNKPALTAWIVEQSVLAAVTTPRLPGEADDAFIHRVLTVEKIQDQEASAAADKGSSIHEALELSLQGKDFDAEWIPFVEAVLPVIEKLGKVIFTEKIVVNEEAGYAGRVDIGIENEREIIIGDFKTTRSMPKKEPWAEAKMQVASYAKCIGNTADKRIVTAVIYISTSAPGEVTLFLSEDWQIAYEKGFKPLLGLWKYINNYDYIPGKGAQ